MGLSACCIGFFRVKLGHILANSLENPTLSQRAALAKEYSQGSEAQSGGIIGPVELGSIHPDLTQLLSISQLGQLWPPLSLEEWQLIIPHEKLIPAQLNESMIQRLLNELFENWLQEGLAKLASNGLISLK
ncbi:MAG TPA: peptidylprolyl isomerase [Coleofasciculaceae cyanobacterium]